MTIPAEIRSVLPQCRVYLRWRVNPSQFLGAPLLMAAVEVEEEVVAAVAQPMMMMMEVRLATVEAKKESGLATREEMVAMLAVLMLLGAASAVFVPVPAPAAPAGAALLSGGARA